MSKLVITITVEPDVNVELHTHVEGVKMKDVDAYLQKALMSLKAEVASFASCPYHKSLSR